MILWWFHFQPPLSGIRVFLIEFRFENSWWFLVRILYHMFSIWNVLVFWILYVACILVLVFLKVGLNKSELIFTLKFFWIFWWIFLFYLNFLKSKYIFWKIWEPGIFCNIYIYMKIWKIDIPETNLPTIRLGQKVLNGGCQPPVALTDTGDVAMLVLSSCDVVELE